MSLFVAVKLSASFMLSEITACNACAQLPISYSKKNHLFIRSYLLHKTLLLSCYISL